MALTEQVLRDRPDVVVIRAAAYALCHTTALALPETTPVILIAGGEVQHPEINGRIDYILEEYAGQADAALFQRLKGRAVFPKYVNWPAVIKAEREAKLYDIVNIGTFEPRKNQAALIPLAQKYKCCLVGEGPLRDDVQVRAEDTCSESVHFTGECAGSEVYKYLSRARVMVHPSIYEGLVMWLITRITLSLTSAQMMMALLPFIPLSIWVSDIINRIIEKPGIALGKRLAIGAREIEYSGGKSPQSRDLAK